MKGLVFLVVSCLCFVQFAEGHTIVSKILADCTAVQTFLGVNYIQLTSNGSEPDLSTIKIGLYTANKTANYLLSSASDMLSDPGFNISLPITIIVHGFAIIPTSFGAAMTSTFVSYGKTNVLFLDSTSVIYAFYARAVTIVRLIGESLAAQLWQMVQAGVNGAKIHMLGHSLGAHICGFTGKRFITLSGGAKLGRVTGMDPAGPCFFDSPSNQALSANDATFVDVIHTDGGFLGIIRPLGHVDFFPNGGSDQTGSIIIADDHSRVWKLVAESVFNPQNFIASKCPDWTSFQKGLCETNPTTTMGYFATPGTTGIYYLRTAGSSLYGLKAAGTRPTAYTKWVWNNLLSFKGIF